MGVGWREHKATFWCDGNTLYFDFGDGYRNVHVCQNSSICRLKMGRIFNVNYPSVKFIWKHENGENKHPFPVIYLFIYF